MPRSVLPTNLAWDLKQLMVFVTRNRLLGHGLRLSPRSPVLGALAFWLTNRCNIKCYMCTLIDGGQDTEYSQNRAEIDYAALTRTIDELETFFPIRPRIHFTGGGEPLLYKRFGGLLRYSNNTKLRYSITTNFLSSRSFLDELVGGRCDKINVSLHGNVDTHDTIVGVPGAFAKVAKNIEMLEARKRARGSRYPLVALNCVISKKNVHHLDQILKDLVRLPVHSITFQHLFFNENDVGHRGGALLDVPEEALLVAELIQKVESTRHRLPVHFFPYIRAADAVHYYGDWHYPFRKSCVVPWLAFMVRPQGDVTTCNGAKLGNIKEDRIADLWNGATNLTFRKGLISQGIFSSCQRCCHRVYY